MFQLDSKSPKSIYEQVVDNIKALIITGAMEEGSKLPSVRELSHLLTINPNTVQKAFRELEREGYTYTVTGRGTFVADKSDIKVDQEKVAAIYDGIADGFLQLLYFGIDAEEAKTECMNVIDNIIRKSRGEAGK